MPKAIIQAFVLDFDEAISLLLLRWYVHSFLLSEMLGLKVQNASPNTLALGSKRNTRKLFLLPAGRSKQVEVLKRPVAAARYGLFPFGAVTRPTFS